MAPLGSGGRGRLTPHRGAHVARGLRGCREIGRVACGPPPALTLFPSGEFEPLVQAVSASFPLAKSGFGTVLGNHEVAKQVLGNEPNGDGFAHAEKGTDQEVLGESPPLLDLPEPEN